MHAGAFRRFLLLISNGSGHHAESSCTLSDVSNPFRRVSITSRIIYTCQISMFGIVISDVMHTICLRSRGKFSVCQHAHDDDKM